MKTPMNEPITMFKKQFFAFRIKISFIVVSLLLYQTGHQEILYKSFLYVLLLIRRANSQKSCNFF